MEFQDEIAGGVTLVRPALQSPDYQPGVSGWSVKLDGSAEFNDVTIRDGTVVSGTQLYYDPAPGPGTLIMSIAAEDGTDEYGNAYPQGVTLYGDGGGRVELLPGPTSGVYLLPRAVPNTEWSHGGLQTITGLAQRGGLSMRSPCTSANSKIATISLFGGGPTTNDTSIQITSERTVMGGGDVVIDRQITSYDQNSMDEWTPVLSGGGAVTLSTVEGWTQRIGSMWYVYAYFVVGTAGTGTAQVTMSLPFVPWRGGRQMLPGDVSGPSPAGPVTAVSHSNGVGAAFQRIRLSDGGDAVGTDLTAGSAWTFEGWLREA